MDASTSFGALTDHFGILAIVKGEGTLGDVLELVESSKTPRAQSRADAQDENEDIVASAYYGNDAGEIYEASCTYALKSGTLDISDLNVGELSAGVVADSLEITTSNGAWPQLTVSGLLGTETMVAPSGKTNKFTLPAITVTAAKRAQLLGFTITGDAKLTGASLAFACDIAEQADGLGEPVAHGISGGTGELSAEFVRIDDAPAWTLAAVIADQGAAAVFNAEVTQAPGATEGQAAWHTTTATAAMMIPRAASG